jgi:transposase
MLRFRSWCDEVLALAFFFGGIIILEPPISSSQCNQTMKSKIEPMKDIAKMLRGHKRLILNWFEMQGKISVGIVEGFNTKAKLTTRKTFGFRTYKVHRIALSHQLGDLPTPDFLPKLC